MTNQRPYFTSKFLILVPPIIILSLSFIIEFFLGAFRLNQLHIDDLFHITGGISITISAAGILWYLNEHNKLVISDNNVLRILSIGILCFAIITWEIFEFVFLDFSFLSEALHKDMVTDMIFGLIPGIITTFTFRNSGPPQR